MKLAVGRIGAVFYAVVAVCAVASAQSYRLQHPLPTATTFDGWGLNWRSSTPLDEQVMDKVSQSGASYVRFDVTWLRVETIPGEYNFTDYDALMAALDSKGTRAVMILAYGNPLYDSGLAPTSTAARQAFVNFAKATVARYAGKGVVWEIWNEPNKSSFWKPEANADRYADLAIQTAAAIRQVHPEEWIVGPGLSGMDFPYLERLFQRGFLQHFDAVSVHPYRSSKPPETVLPEYWALQNLINRYKPANKVVPVMSSEWGFSLKWPGFDESLQARYIVRSLLSNSIGGVGLSVIYSLKDPGANPNESHNWYGLHDYNMVERQSFSAVSRFADALKGYRFGTRLDLLDENDYCMVLTNGIHQKLVVWTSGDPHTAIVPSSPGSFNGLTFAGTPFTKTASGGGVTLTVTGEPQILSTVGSNPFLALLADWKHLPVSAYVGSSAEAQALLAEALVSPAWQLAPSGTTLKVEDLTDPFNVFTAPGFSRTLTGLNTLTLGSLSVQEVLTDLPRIHDQSDWPRMLRLTLQTPDGATAKQTCVMLPSKPLWISILTPQDNRLTLQLENPTGIALTGTLKAQKVGGSEFTYDGSFVTGQKVKRVFVDQLSRTDIAAGFRLSLTAGDAELTSRDLKVVRLPDPKAGEYTYFAGGDRKIDMTALLSVVGAPGGASITGMKTLKLDYTMGAGKRFISVLSPPSLLNVQLPSPHKIGMWVYGDNSGNSLRLRYIDATQQVFQFTFGKLDWSGWRWLEAPLDGRQASYWEGANDGVVHYPVRILSPILVDSRRDKATAGAVMFAGPTVLSFGN